MNRLGLQSRLLILTLLVLAGSLGLTGWVLDASFRASNVAAAEEQLELIIYSVMGAVEEAESGLFLPEDATQGGLSRPESGLYALVQTSDGESLWVSRSARLSDVDFAPAAGRLAPGDFRFLDGRNRGVDLFFLSYAVIWEDRGEEVELLFRAAADTRPFEVQVAEFRRNLWLGLLAVAGLLMLVQVIAVRVGLRPVRVMADEVAELEAGKRTALSGDYPHELTGLANNLDRFIEHETASRARYRNALDDLAHSLKTPLAVIRNALREDGDAGADNSARSLLRDQLDRMETTVAHQLSRAVSSGPVVVGHLTGVRRIVERLCKALQTAYQDKNLQLEIAGRASGVMMLPSVVTDGEQRAIVDAKRRRRDGDRVSRIPNHGLRRVGREREVSRIGVARAEYRGKYKRTGMARAERDLVLVGRPRDLGTPSCVYEPPSKR